MLPAARVRRASFLPREVRTSAATVICSLKFVSPVSGLRSPIRQLDRPPGLSKANVGSNTRKISVLKINYTNNVLTEVSSWIDRMASAINFAIDNDLIRVDFHAASESGIEFVKTTSFSSDSSIRFTAGPESTACVAHAETLAAPFSSKASAPFTSVPAVSIRDRKHTSELQS